MANDVRHENAVRDTLATSVRSAIHAGTGANVTCKLYAEAVGAQATVILSIDLGTAPFAAVTSQHIDYTGTATGTKTGAGTATALSFALFDRTTTPTKVLQGTAGTTGGTFDLEITNNVIKQNEKVSLTSMVYTASL